DPAALMRIVQGLMIYEHVAADFYVAELSAARRAESQIRAIEGMLSALLALDAAPLKAARAPERRLVGICRHFTLLMTAMLRAKGVPARARCGFGSYFNPGYFEDHWVCEYWRAEEGRWALADPQFDAVWREKLGIEHDVLDVPRDRFLVAGDAWALCRDGTLDPDRFGICFSELRGLWFVAGNLVRDLAALNGMEMLPWDIWGAMPAVDTVLDDEALAFFDALAAPLHAPDRHIGALRRRYAEDDGLRVPDRVFNALRQCEEAILAA
ncbi:MAG TPA: transglutaminase-like domain-containing protein, partial [Alphaproteobacteria bacterium]|nr:transglutaminase-like domain-containing protein [Alphaproteobacteria bacterium]